MEPWGQAETATKPSLPGIPFGQQIKRSIKGNLDS